MTDRASVHRSCGSCAVRRSWACLVGAKFDVHMFSDFLYRRLGRKLPPAPMQSQTGIQDVNGATLTRWFSLQLQHVPPKWNFT
jgi:hypothetical protein